MSAKLYSICNVKVIFYQIRIHKQTYLKVEGSADGNQNRILLSKTINLNNQDLLVEAINEIKCKELQQRKTLI